MLILLISGMSLHANVRLPQILGSNMVLQRDVPLKIWGWADPREKVTVTFSGQSVSTKANRDGTWMVELDPVPAGGPFDMLIGGQSVIVLENILVGDVWVCSGQSNMEWNMSNVNNSGEEIASADFPEIRLFDVPRNVQLQPVDDIPSGTWRECTPESVRNFSAVGYFFGREIHREVGVPIGLISSNWGGTNVETWTSREMALTDPEMAKVVSEMKTMDMEELKAQKEKEKRDLLVSLGALEEGIIDGKALWAEPGIDLSGWKEMDVPGLWERQGLTGVDGVVWFRRTFMLTEEAAASDAVLYLGPVDDSDRTWINGNQVGETTDKYNEHRKYVVSKDFLTPGENTVVVRVEDYRGGGGIYGVPAEIYLMTGDGNIPLAGKWKYRVSAQSLEIKIELALGPNEKPTLLFNGMIHPLLNYAVKGAIWYQGEANAWNAYRYRTRFPNMIRDWRNQWGNPEMGFYFVQLANYMAEKDLPGESEWAELREAQSMTLSLPKTGMAVTIDIGEADDIHPRNKQDVGYRLALAALHDTYGKDIVYSGPMFRHMEIREGKVAVEFDHTGSGLMIDDKYGYVKGFAIAGADRKFHWARGVLKDNRIWLWCADVKEPVAVRYAWADNPEDANVYNQEGLPASPFRTDDWPGITVGK